MMKSICLLVISILMAASSNAQLSLTDIERVDSLQRADPKPVFVFIHTKWCSYCRIMQRNTFRSKEVIEALGAYYVVFLDAEEKKNLTFNNRVFPFNPTGTNTGSHALAVALGEIKGRLSFPSITILNQRYEIVHQQSGFLESEQLPKVLDVLSRHQLEGN